MIQGIKAAAVILLAVLIAGPAFAQPSGADLYKKCVSCHGADGLATSMVAQNMKVLSFKDAEMLKASDARFFAATKNGKGKMPAYKGKMTDAQIKEVIAYIRTLQK
jgi:mono/diheme cytochrome c family protein